MKKILLSFVFGLFGLSALAQVEHLKFMGISLDGSISDFHNALVAKGLTENKSKSELYAPRGG